MFIGVGARIISKMSQGSILIIYAKYLRNGSKTSQGSILIIHA